MLEKELVQYKIYQKLSNKILLGTQSLLNQVLYFFALRPTKKFWGIVYDSLSKQPLDPVIVKLLYVDGREIETCVTDMEGRYGFLARPGKFKIHVRKTNYNFPSHVVSGQNDGIYENIYRGEFFVLQDDSEVVAPNIPMDAIAADWNQSAKISVVNNYPQFRLWSRRVFAFIFWALLFYLGFLTWKLLPEVNFYYFFIFGIYFALLCLAKLLPEPRLWGKLNLDTPDFKNEKIYLKLTEPRFPGMSFGKAAVHEDGRFLLRSKSGKYVLMVSKLGKTGEELLAEMPVTISNLGVFNGSITLSK